MIYSKLVYTNEPYFTIPATDNNYHITVLTPRDGVGGSLKMTQGDGVGGSFLLLLLNLFIYNGYSRSDGGKSYYYDQRYQKSL